MKVIINTIPLLTPKTGIGYYISNLCRHLELYEELSITPTYKPMGRFVAITLKTVSSPLKKTLKDKYPQRMAEILFDIAMSPFSISSKLKLRKIDIKDFDLYHDPCHSIIKEFKDIPRIVDIHDLAAIKYPEWVNPNYRKQMEKDLEDLLSSNRIIVKSQYIKNELVNDFGIDPSIIDVIPNALGSSYHVIGEKLGKREKLGKLIKKDYLLFTGTIEPRKNLETLFKAFRIIRNKYDLDLIVAGGFGWRFEEIITIPQELGIERNVMFTGYTSEKDLSLLYNYAKLFILPSLYEGFGIPPLEAMACGTPVIASNASAIPEVVGDAALLFNPHDHEELAHLIDKVLSSEELAANLREKGLERVKLFSWSKTAEITVQTYKKTLEN